jgi:hypothetical protein
MQFGADNNAGPNIPNKTILRAQNHEEPTLEVRNVPTGDLVTGGGLRVSGGRYGVVATAGDGNEPDTYGVIGRGGGIGVVGEGIHGVWGNATRGGFGVWGYSQQAIGVLGECTNYNGRGVSGNNHNGGNGVVGRTWGGPDNWDRAAVFGESLPDAGDPNDVNNPNGKAAGVWGYSTAGYGGVFITGQAFENGDVGFPDSGGLRVVGKIVKSGGEYCEAVPHPDGSQRLLYAPLSPESWYEDFGRAELVEGRAEVQLDADFAAVLGIDDDSYHVFLTPEGDTSGLYVSGRDARAFTVREQQNGTSSAWFSYRVVAKNKHRQPRRLAKLEEPGQLTKPRQTQFQPRSDRPDLPV